MDFGVVSHKQASPNEAIALKPRNEDHSNGSAMNLKHQLSAALVEDNWRLPKMQRPHSEVDFGRSNLWPNDGQKMLSFSSSQLHCNSGMDSNGSSRSIAFSIGQNEHPSRIGGGLNERVKGAFSPSQWMELEHQALIYKHIVANVPVPSNLLVPLKRSLYSYGSPTSYASNFLGWGPFHVGYPGSNDSEPDRCRRTDGKKWRCSREAVPDHKYCERHINRGRHRSRKPVEGQTGHALTSSSKPSPNSTNIANASLHHLANRKQGFQGPSLMISPTISLKPKDSHFSIQKQHVQSEFGLVSSDSLLNPSERISYMTTTNSDSFSGFNDNDCPKNQSNRASGPTWPEELKSDWTQLSMSIKEKSTISSLRLSSHELDPTHMSLGTGHDMGQKQQSWMPIMGGPLAEVLTSTASTSSSGNSPHNKGPENGGLYNGVLGSALLSSAAIPSL